MINYKYYNANPKGLNTNDCVIRAISTFHNSFCTNGYIYNKDEITSSYNLIYNNLAQFGIKKSLMFNDERCYMQFLKKTLGLKEIIPIKRMKVNDLFNTNIPKQGVLINLKGHLTFMSRDYVIHDTFDCREEYIESILGYF